jgi:hypothetical protein
MALKAILAASEFESLAEPVKAFYKKSDGDDETKAFVLDAEGVEDVGGLKKALQAERSNVTAVKKELADVVMKYKDIDPAKALDAQNKLKEIEDKQLQDAGEFEILKTKLLAEKETAVATIQSELTGQLTKTQSQLHKVLVADRLRKEFSDQEGFAKSSDLFVDLASRGVTLDPESYELRFPEGKGASVTEYVTNLKGTDDFGVFFASDLSTGSGSSTQTQGGKIPTASKKASEMTTLEKVAFVKEHGTAAWEEHLKKV